MHKHSLGDSREASARFRCVYQGYAARSTAVDGVAGRISPVSCILSRSHAYLCSDTARCARRRPVDEQLEGLPQCHARYGVRHRGRRLGDKGGSCHGVPLARIRVFLPFYLQRCGPAQKREETFENLLRAVQTGVNGNVRMRAAPARWSDVVPECGGVRAPDERNRERNLDERRVAVG